MPTSRQGPCFGEQAFPLIVSDGLSVDRRPPSKSEQKIHHEQQRDREDCRAYGEFYSPAGASYVVVVLRAVPCEGIRCLDSRSRCQHSLGSDESIEIGIFGILYLTVTESSQSSCSFAALCELKFVKA